MVLHQGKIAEMRTGEGKTLVATAPVYLNALPGKGVHVVTVNDYLARRDANWMRPVYAALGMEVGIVVPGMRPDDKRAAYAADITYGTNNEYGFDYLRDNMALRKEERFQRAPFYAIVDEVDSILIDEARTPLIISGPADDSPQMYVKVNRIVPKLIRQATEEGEGDFWVDEKQKQVHLSEAGMSHAEALLKEAGVLGEDDSLWDAKNLMAVHHLNAGLRAHSLYNRDVDYIVRDGEVIIVDEFTGRTLAGRRWSDGLHQAVEAKEGVPIQRENQTLASITFQNYFRLYKKLSGMTGTADTEAYEFQNIYGLEVVVIPTHRPMVRKDHADLVFLKQDGKFRAVLADIKDCYARKQPVLVGTTSIETSELISRMLTKEGLPHEVLNAKQHEREAHIVAQAGRPGAVTIATNMAGRGTDIVLGGNLEAELHALPEGTDDATRDAVRAAWKERHAEVLAAGGLHIIGTERHESRRIDNQLRGRSGRQGDPGSSRFYLSLEDNLMRIFAPGWMGGFMEKWGGMQQDDALESGMVTRQIEKMQRKCEAHNFDIRKHLLEYDDVANDQRKVIYEQRNELLDAETVDETVRNIRADVFESIARQYVPEHSIDEQWDLPGLTKKLETDFGIHVDLVAAAAGHSADFTAADLWKIVQKAAVEHFERKEQEFGAETMRSVEKYLMLQVLDQHWKDHLASMDYLRQGIHLRGYAQKQPKQEFKREAFELFSSMLDEVKLELTTILARVRLRSEEEVQQMEAEQQRRQQAAAMQFQHSEAQAFAPSENEVAAAMASGDAGNEVEAQALAAGVKVGRNDPCPCGSGKKYKSCHGKIA
jgi:preprotein translocase subunit SecA